MYRTPIIIGIGIITIAVCIFLYRNKAQDSSPTTAAPTTTSPTTTAPTTAAPTTTAPTTTAPTKAAPYTTAPTTTAPSTSAPVTPVTCACDNSNQKICNNYGSNNQNTVDSWNKGFVAQNQTDRISWLGVGSCETMPADVAAKLAAQKASATPPPVCVCDSGVPGKCFNYGSDSQNQNTVSAWNKDFAVNRPGRISWIGAASDSCNKMPDDIAAKLAVQKIPGCVCDSGKMGTCNNFGSRATNQNNVDTLNQGFVDKPTISWLGEADDNCKNMPADIDAKLKTKISFLATKGS